MALPTSDQPPGEGSTGPFPCPSDDTEPDAMRALQIDFEDGFDGDTVIVRADGDELWREEGVTTNLSASVATIARVEIREGARIEVEVPTRGLVAATQVETPYLEVRIDAGGLALTPSQDLPRHL